jgi:hypothetical protein
LLSEEREAFSNIRFFRDLKSWYLGDDVKLEGSRFRLSNSAMAYLVLLAPNVDRLRKLYGYFENQKEEIIPTLNSLKPEEKTRCYSKIVDMALKFRNLEWESFNFEAAREFISTSRLSQDDPQAWKAFLKKWRDLQQNNTEFNFVEIPLALNPEILESFVRSFR